MRYLKRVGRPLQPGRRPGRPMVVSPIRIGTLDPSKQQQDHVGRSPESDAPVETKIRQARSMRRRCRRVPAARSSFAGFRFPPDVITLAVRWYSRYGLSYRDVLPRTCAAATTNSIRMLARKVNSRRPSPNSPSLSDGGAIAGSSRPFSVNATAPHPPVNSRLSRHHVGGIGPSLRAYRKQRQQGRRIRVLIQRSLSTPGSPRMWCSRKRSVVESCSGIANWSGFGAPLEVRELPSLHDPVRRFPKKKTEDSLHEPRAGGRVAADHKSRALTGQLL